MNNPSPLMGEYPVSSAEEMNVLVERNRDNGWEDLPLNKRAFAHEYILHYKQREAAESAGYVKKSGARLLRDPLVAAYVQHLQSIQLTNNIITKDFINTHRLELLMMAKGEMPIRHVLPDGEEVSVCKTQLGEANNILRDLSKSIDYDKESGNKTAPVSINIDMGALFGDRDSSGIDMGSVINVIEGEIEQ